MFLFLQVHHWPTLFSSATCSRRYASWWVSNCHMKTFEEVGCESRIWYLTLQCACVDLYQQVIPQSPVVERLLQRLMHLLGQEAEFQQELLQVLGILDTLFASLTPKTEVPSLGVPPVSQEAQLQATWHSIQNYAWSDDLTETCRRKENGKRKTTNTQHECGSVIA